MGMRKDGLVGKVYRRKCDNCQNDYVGLGRRFCSRACQGLSIRGKPPHNKGKPLSELQKKKISKTRIERGVAKGKNNPRWGISKYRTKDEERKAGLVSARKSYLKHIDTRRFYYRQLNHKRRRATGSHSREDWEKLKAKYNHCCAICGMQEPFTEQQYQFLTEDHIVPVSKGGSNDIENIQPLCKSCNSRKHNK